MCTNLILRLIKTEVVVEKVGAHSFGDHLLEVVGWACCRIALLLVVAGVVATATFHLTIMLIEFVETFAARCLLPTKTAATIEKIVQLLQTCFGVEVIATSTSLQDARILDTRILLLRTHPERKTKGRELANVGEQWKVESLRM